MRVVVVGGGKVGVYLARHLSKTGQVVSVIEEKPERARKVTTETKVLVFEGDGTDIELFARRGCASIGLGAGRHRTG